MARTIWVIKDELLSAGAGSVPSSLVQSGAAWRRGLTQALCLKGESEVSVSVRQATSQDIEHLVPLFDGYREFYGQPSDPGLARAFLLERFRHHESVVLLATDPEGVGIGFVQLYPSFSSVRMARTYILNDLFVAPSARRKGVAAQLLKQAAEYGRAAGAVRLSLSTAHTNKEAQHLYEVLGWRRDETFREYGLVL